MKSTTLISICAMVCFLMAINPAAAALYDGFEDGSIDYSMWTVGGSTRAYYGGPGGSWLYLNDEVISSDGYLRNQVIRGRC